MADAKHIYTEEETEELRRAHNSSKNILSHSYSQSIIDEAEKGWEKDFNRVISGETTLEEIEASLLANWDNKAALQNRIYELESEFRESETILNNSNDTNHLFYERYKSYVDGLRRRINQLKDDLSNKNKLL